MQLEQLPKITKNKKRRGGQGYGSGRGKTSGRGTKGQNARSSMPIAFEGGQSQLIKRVPFLRGKGRNKSMKSEVYPLLLSKLDLLSTTKPVTLKLLKEAGIVQEDIKKVKLLGSNISKKLTIHLPCSKSAKKAIIDAGGEVV